MKKILLTFATVLALTACIGGKPTPTGDAKKDAKVAMEYLVSEINKCTSTEQLNNLDKGEFKEITKEFEAYGKEHPEYYKEFRKEGMKLFGDVMIAAQKKAEELKAAGK